MKNNRDFLIISCIIISGMMIIAALTSNNPLTFAGLGIIVAFCGYLLLTDDGSKKSLKGLLQVVEVESMTTKTKHLSVIEECTPEEENQGLLQVIYQDGKFFNQVTLEEVRNRLKQLK